MVITADVADRDRMQEVIALAKSRFGHIDGVIHSAGSADQAGIIQRRTREATDEILAAKVRGTLVLDELLAGSGLDFLVLCSTRGTAVWDGLFGQVGYLAANEFLDAFAFYKRAVDDVYTVTINWDPWREVGMAAQALKQQVKDGKMGRVLTTANSLTASEGAEVFNRILNHRFAQVVVSVAALDAVRKNFSRQQQPGLEQEIERPQMTRHARPEVAIAFTPATNESERVLANIWQDLLGIQEVGVDDNFFDLGGDSLLLLRVQAKIREALGTELSPAEMFEHPTISALARHLSQPATESPGLGSVQDRAQMQRTAMARQRQSVKRG
jgi:NADP-dependent 3-hydroxy acid dehydrogenase YdfG/acyl carrier protein